MSFKMRSTDLGDVSMEDGDTSAESSGLIGQLSKRREVSRLKADGLHESVEQSAFFATDSQADTQADIQIDQAIAQLLTEDFHRQWDHSKQLAKQFSEWGDRSIPILLRHLNAQSDPDIQWFLVRILSRFAHPSVIEALSALLVKTSNEHLQMEITKALAGFGDCAITCLSSLLTVSVDQALEPTTHRQRLLAAQVLSRIRRTKTIEPLLTVADDPDPVLREIAIEALGSFHDARITPLLLAALEDEPAICLEAIRALGRRSDLLSAVDLVTPLQSCLHSPHEVIACESAMALGRLGHRLAITALGEQLSEPIATPVKTSIVQALGRLHSKQWPLLL